MKSNNTNNIEQKKVFWIDDSPDNLNDNLYLHMIKLWEKNIKSEILLFGDYDMISNGYSEEVLNIKSSALKESILIEFLKYCYDKHGYSNPQIEKEWHLISDIAYSKDLIMEDKMNVIITSKADLVKLYGIYLNKKDIYLNELTSLVDSLIKKLCASNNSIFVVDLCLTRIDGEYKDKIFVTPKLQIEEKIPSMEIYNHLVKEYKKENVVLFTSFFYAHTFIESWCKCYKKLYGINEKEEISVYSRNGEIVFPAKSEKKNLIEILGGD